MKPSAISSSEDRLFCNASGWVMPSHKGKLELTWVGKDDRPRLEPRVLVEDPAKSYGDARAENMLIFGDNLLALKALEQDFAGKIKCIFIDPPYNTGSAFEHYDDGVEHSLWLSLIRPRLELLWLLLASYFAVTLSGPGAHLDRLRVPSDATGGIAPAVEEQLNARQKRIMVQVQTEGGVTSGWCRKAFGIAYNTAFFDLSGLVERGLLEREGKGRATRYRLPAGRQ